MAPSANGQRAAVQHTVYVVERRVEFRELNSQIDPNSDHNAYEPEISYLDFAYQDEKQAYAVAIREQIFELDGDYGSRKHNGRKIAAQANLSLKERLKSLHKEVDVAAEAHEMHEPVVKFEVLEFPVTAVQPFQETVFLNELGHESESEDIEDEEEELGDEEEEDEEGEEGVEEPEGEEEEDDEEGEDDLEDLDDDDEGEEVDDDDDDEDDDSDDASPQTKKQRK